MVRYVLSPDLVGLTKPHRETRSVQTSPLLSKQQRKQQHPVVPGGDPTENISMSTGTSTSTQTSPSPFTFGGTLTSTSTTRAENVVAQQRPVVPGFGPTESVSMNTGTFTFTQTSPYSFCFGDTPASTTRAQGGVSFPSSPDPPFGFRFPPTREFGFRYTGTPTRAKQHCQQRGRGTTDGLSTFQVGTFTRPRTSPDHLFSFGPPARTDALLTAPLFASPAYSDNGGSFQASSSAKPFGTPHTSS